MRHKYLHVLIFSLFAFKWVGGETVNGERVVFNKTPEVSEEKIFERGAMIMFQNLNLNEYLAPSPDCFIKAVKGFKKMKADGLLKKDILTIIDFSLSSSSKRLWVIDMKTNQILLQTVVAHGKNSGDEFAKNFSNRNNSNMSSIGFYKTAETYNGKHGFSLRLDGLERGFNDMARQRAIVIHGADYASENIAKQQGRLGRSLGCPAIPQNIKKHLIELIKEESCLFIYYPSSSYLSRSQFLI